MKMVAVFDLDGTLLRGNSFHLWLRFVLLNAGLPLKSKVAVVLLCLRRVLRLIDHRELKQSVMRITQRVLKEEFCNSFVRSCVSPRLSKVCLSKLSEHRRDGAEIVLATAAPIDYVRCIVVDLGISRFVASTLDVDGNLDEVIRERKLHAVSDLVGDDRITFAYSDHVDDLPLLRSAKQAILVNPDPDQKAALGAELARYELLSDD